MHLRSLAVIAGLALAGCGTIGNNTPGVPSPADSIYAADNAYVAAANLASLYVHLPACAPGGSPICSDPSIVAKIRSEDNNAYNALLTATRTIQTASPGSPQIQVALEAALAAIAQFQNDTNTLKVK